MTPRHGGREGGRASSADDDHLVLGGAQLGEYPGADRAQADQHEVAAEVLGRRMPDGALAEGIAGVHRGGHHQR
ncbi:hypothetical protein [Streptomyces sp. cg2]|uniref:hypothetical protein n=1 Tax=Streptomyces sp. cg2 TaxID=3238799 RepID=UPI0034E1EDB8